MDVQIERTIVEWCMCGGVMFLSCSAIGLSTYDAEFQFLGVVALALGLGSNPSSIIGS